MISHLGHKYVSINNVNLCSDHLSLQAEGQPDVLLKVPPAWTIFSQHCPSGLPLSGAVVLHLYQHIVQIHV